MRSRSPPSAELPHENALRRGKGCEHGAHGAVRGRRRSGPASPVTDTARSAPVSLPGALGHSRGRSGSDTAPYWLQQVLRGRPARAAFTAFAVADHAAPVHAWTRRGCASMRSATRPPVQLSAADRVEAPLLQQAAAHTPPAPSRPRRRR